MKKSSTDFFEKRLNVFLFLFVPPVLLYAKTLGYGFTPLDEKWLIIDNVEYLKQWKSLTDSFTSSLYNLYYRPLLAVSIFLDFKIAGLSTNFYHFTNLIWHLICVFCLFRFLTLFHVPKKVAACFSLLFAVHPILVHAVAWVPGRNDLMLCAFALGSLIHLKKYLDEKNPRYLILNLLLFVCALFTKESALSLPLIFFVITYKSLPTKNLLSSVAAWIIIASGWLLLRNAIVPDIQASALSFPDRLVNFSAGFFTYLGKSLFPFPQSVHPTKTLVSFLIGTTTLFILIVFCFKPGVKDKKAAATGLLLFLVLIILPLTYSSGRSNPDFYEHRVYTSICGLILFFTQLKFDYSSKIFQYLFIGLAIFFFGKAFLRMNSYKDEPSFLVVAVKEQPNYFLFQANYANYLSHVGDFAGAIPYYTKAITLRPDKIEFYNDRGRANYQTGNFKAAIHDISFAIEKSKFTMDYYINRSYAYLADNDIENAMKDLYILIKCCRESVPEDLKADVGAKWRAIMQTLNSELALQPNNDQLLAHRAKLFFDTGQKEKGFSDLQKALGISPQNLEYQKLFRENQ